MKSAKQKSKPWADCPPTGRLLRPQEVFERTGLSRSQVYAMISEGQFPPFLKVSQRAAALPEAWLDCFISDRAQSALSNLHTAQNEAEHI